MKKITASFFQPDFVPIGDTACNWLQAANSCTRCHACSQSCPAYRLAPHEHLSPRGRLQIIKLIADGKIKEIPADLIQPMLSSCLVCARCSGACAAHLPVAHQMLAFRRAMDFPLAPFTARVLLFVHTQWPRVFDKIIRTLTVARRFKLIYLIRPLWPKWAAKLNRILPAKLQPLHTLLPTYPIDSNQAADFIYLPSLYAQYVDGNVGLCALHAAQAKHPLIWAQMSSGLTHYLYGSRGRCLQALKALISRWEKTGNHPLPILTDSVEIYLFLRHCSFLFTRWPSWEQAAKQVEKQVRFITDFKPLHPQASSDGKTALDISAVLYPADEVAQKAHQILYAQMGKNLLECEYSAFPLPAAGQGFLARAQAERWVLQQVEDLTRQQITDVFCLSGWAALELRAALKRKYPSVRAHHIAYLWKNYAFTQQ